MPRPDIKVRLAQNDEAHLVEALFEETFYMGGWHPKFKTVFPYWLVAEITGEIVGTINIRLSLPIASIEMLAMSPELGTIDRRRVTGMLLDSAIVICAALGAEAVSSIIPDAMESYREVLKDMGYETGEHGVTMFGGV